MTNQDIAGLLLQGLLMTLWLSLLAAAFSLVVGTIVGVMRVSPLVPVAALAQGYIEFFRNIPLLIILFFVLNGLPQIGITLDFLGQGGFFETAVVGLTAYHSPYVAEILRGALQSISRGQMEASRSLGFSWLGAMRHVLLPQAFRTMVPPIGNLGSALVRNTSLATAVGVAELIHQAEFIEGRTFNPNIFIIAGLMYLIFTIPLGVGINALEARVSLARIRR
jgi:putative glutamine transport system permease protein